MNFLFGFFQENRKFVLNVSKKIEKEQIVLVTSEKGQFLRKKAHLPQNPQIFVEKTLQNKLLLQNKNVLTSIQ